MNGRILWVVERRGFSNYWQVSSSDVRPTRQQARDLLRKCKQDNPTFGYRVRSYVPEQVRM
jgi:hypothetical protein